MYKQTPIQKKVLDYTKIKGEKIKINIPEEISKRIKTYCEIIPDVEWSGVLLYTVEGSIKDISNMSIEVKDIILMDKGSAASTGFEFGENSISTEGFGDAHIDYCDEFDEGIFYKMGMIHSHNTMEVFFSNTDMNDLDENAGNHNYYLSMIVNNKLDIIAKVALEVVIDGEFPADYSAKDDEGNPYIFSKGKIPIKQKRLVTIDCDISYNKNPQKEEFWIRNLIKVLHKPSPISQYSYLGNGNQWGNAYNYKKNFNYQKTNHYKTSFKKDKKVVNTNTGGNLPALNVMRFVLACLEEEPLKLVHETYYEDLEVFTKEALEEEIIFNFDKFDAYKVRETFLSESEILYLALRYLGDLTTKDFNTLIKLYPEEVINYLDDFTEDYSAINHHIKDRLEIEVYPFLRRLGRDNNYPLFLISNLKNLIK